MKITLLEELGEVNVINLFRTEVYKLFISKSFWLVFIMSTLFGITMTSDSHTFITGYENIGVSFYYACLLMVFPILLGAISFGNDFGDRTINNGVCAGHSRFQIFICKVSAYFIGVNLVILFSPIVNVILNIILHRYTAVYFMNEGNILAKTIITTSLLGMAMSSVSIFIAFMFRDIGKTVGISVGIYFINISLLNSTNDIRTTIFRYLPLAQARLILYRPLIPNQFKDAGLIGICIILFFLSISYFLFKKAELR